MLLVHSHFVQRAALRQRLSSRQCSTASEPKPHVRRGQVHSRATNPASLLPGSTGLHQIRPVPRIRPSAINCIWPTRIVGHHSAQVWSEGVVEADLRPQQRVVSGRPVRSTRMLPARSAT
jgi:hypothetical protein